MLIHFQGVPVGIPLGSAGVLNPALVLYTYCRCWCHHIEINYHTRSQEPMVGNSLVLVAANMYHKMSQENMLEEENMKLGGKLNSIAPKKLRGTSLFYESLNTLCELQINERSSSQIGEKKERPVEFWRHCVVLLTVASLCHTCWHLL